MKNFIYLLVFTLLFSFSAYAQNEGISFQGLARNTAGEVLVSQKISLRLSILLDSESGAVAYTETRQTTTNPQGIFAVVLGDTNTLTKSTNFSAITWTTAPKFIKVEMDPNAGTNFTAMGTSKLQPVPLAYYAYGVDAENVDGILPVGSGGTGVASIQALKTSMGVDQVNNTSDANKPLSIVNQAALATKVDKEIGKGLSSNDYTTAEKIKLAAITGNVSGPQGLQGLPGAAGAAGLPGATGATGSQGPAGPIGPAGLTWKGLWSATGTYSKDDVVGFNGASYFCLAPISNSSSTPTSDPTKWALLASQGANGPQGPTGSAGLPGLPGQAGAAGATGTQGPIGLTGLQGLTGLPGADGPQGPTGATGIQGAAGPIGPAGLTWKGVWSTTGAYAKDDVVGFNGASYFCLAPVSNSSATPTNDPTKWALLASQGADGPQGPTGSAGVAGATGPQGPIGATGAIGLQGPIGLTGATGATGLLTGGTTAGNTPYWDGSQWVLNSSNLFNNGSNLGIGTTNPSEKLDLVGNLKTSGTIKAGTITYPNTAGTNGFYLKTDGTGTASWAAISGVPYTGATGAVNLGGYDLTVNGLTIGTGKDNSSNTFNTIVGGSNPTRTFTSVVSNTAIGYNTISSSTPGNNNTAIGAWSLVNNTGEENSAMGVGALERNLAGGKNTAIGYYALRGNTTGSNNTAIGYAADLADGLSNSTAIGSGATVAASNTIQLGNTDVLNVKTSGTLTAGVVIYPKVHGTSGQVLSTTGTGALTWTTPSSGITTMAAIGSTPNANGASISGATLNLQPANATNGGVVTTGDQTFAGSKTFNNNIKVNSLKIGAPASGSQNTMFGASAFQYGTPGNNNTAIGANSLASTTNSTNGGSPGGNDNTAVGSDAIRQGQTSGNGNRNTGVGSRALTNASDASNNTGLGYATLTDATGGQNTAVGSGALAAITTGTSNTAVGYGATVSSGAQTNSTAIGNGATVAASNTIQLGNTDVLNVKTSGTLTAGTITYPNIAGTNGFYLKTDGTGTASWAAVSAPGVPYTGATGAVNLGGYDLTVNELAIGSGKVGTSGSSSNTIVGGAGVSRAFTTVLSNTAIGYNTMSSATPGNNNTAIGAYSLVSTTGRENSVVGAAAMERNLGGNENTAIGYYAMQNNLSGSGNTALGYKAGFSSDNTTVNNATAIGYQAKVAASNTIQLGADGTNGTTAITNVKTSGTLTAGTITYPNAHNSTTGQVLTINNAGTASWASASSGVPYTGATGAVNLGSYDLTVNGMTIGSGKVGSSATLNTIVGEYALNRDNTSRGQDNTAIGYKSMGNETASATSAGTKNTAVGSWTLIGNSGTENSVLGNAAMEQNQGGSGNTAMGARALQTNLTGSNNTAIGYAAGVLTNNLSNATAIGNGATVAASNTIQLGNTSVTNVITSGNLTANGILFGRGGGNISSNTAVGTNTLNSNVSGGDNTAIGNATLSLNTTGFQNTANGFEALKRNTTGGYNTATGNSSLSSNTTGGQNTAVGTESMMSNTTGNGNTAIGRQSLASNTIGNYNTGLGIDALSGNTTGSYSVGIGQGALITNTTGRDNTAVGPGADVATGALTNATAIGNGAVVSASNSVRLGNTAVTSIGGQVAWTAASDSRIKKNIVNSNYGLSTVLQLRPVEYNLTTNDLRQVGFIAQEVQKLVPEVVTGKEGDLSKGEILGITYSNLVPVLTKAIQEQQKQIESQQKLIEELQSYKNAISSMQKELEELKKLIKGMEK